MNDVDDAILSRIEDTWKSRRDSGFLCRSFIPPFFLLSCTLQENDPKLFNTDVLSVL